MTHTDNSFCHGTRPPACNTCGEWGSSGHPGISGKKKAAMSTWWFDLPSDKVYLVAVGITTITFYRLECPSEEIVGLFSLFYFICLFSQGKTLEFQQYFCTKITGVGQGMGGAVQTSQ